MSQQPGRLQVGHHVIGGPLPGRSTGGSRDRDDSDVKFNLKYCSVVPDHVTQLAPRSRPRRRPRPASAGGRLRISHHDSGGRALRPAQASTCSELIHSLARRRRLTHGGVRGGGKACCPAGPGRSTGSGRGDSDVKFNLKSFFVVFITCSESTKYSDIVWPGGGGGRPIRVTSPGLGRGLGRGRRCGRRHRAFPSRG